MADMIPLVAILGFFGVAAFVTWSVSRSRERRAQIQADVQSRLIERFSTASELVEFLQSSAGREFVSGVKSAPLLHAKERAVASLSRAFVLTAIGVAFIALWLVGGGTGYGMNVPGFILTALGIANLLGAIVSLKTLGRAERTESDLPPARTDSSF